MLERQMELRKIKWWWVALAGAWIVSLLITAYFRGEPDPPTLTEIREVLPPADPINWPARDFEWTAQPAPLFPIPPYAEYLREARIVIDPGHGGRKNIKPKGWKTGPTGLREAEINLNVALFLAEFLESAGAEVRLTRTRDVYLARHEGADLRARAAMANDWPADALISIHHNAVSRPEVNYTQIFYHDDAQEYPATLSLGHHLLLGLQDALRLEQQIPVALLSDKLIEERGFGLLRAAKRPAVLLEGSFFTNPEEEDRLRDPLYNRREAYGLFLGLARWVQAGLPRARWRAGSPSVLSPGEVGYVELLDGLSHRPRVREHEKLVIDSLFVRLNGSPLPAHFDADKRMLEFTVPQNLRAGRHQLRVDFVNLFGQPPVDPYLRLNVRGN